MKLLEEGIRAKRKRINILEKDTKRIREELPGTLSCLDFLYICSLFLVANDKSILHHDNIQKQKIENFLEISLKEVINDSHNPNKVIFNFSSYELSHVEKSILCKGLNFSVKPKSIKYSEFLLPFELVPSIKYVRKIFRKTITSNLLISTGTCAYQGFKNVSFSENLCNEDLSLMKFRLLRCVKYCSFT